MRVAEYRTWKKLVLQGEHPGSGLKKKTANRDPTSSCDIHQSHLLNQEEGILWQRRSNHFQRPSQSEGVWLLANHVLINCTASRMSTWSLCSSYSKKSNRLKLSEIRCLEEVRKTNDPNYCLYHRMLGTLPRTATSLQMSFRLWLMQRCWSLVQSRRRRPPTWQLRHLFNLDEISH